MPLKAYYIARGIDILRVHGTSYGSYPTSFQSKSLTITLDAERHKYISVFKYGSVVLFNVPQDEHAEHLFAIQEAANSVTIPPNLQHTEDYQISVDPGTQPFKRGSRMNIHDQIVVHELDSNILQVVGGVMAQTVAMDYYAVLVERMVDTFMSMNKTMGETGKIHEDRKKMFALIASNNTVITSVVSKLGIFEGSDVAWEDGDAWEIWDGLRKDFELDYRFKDLSMKLEIVRDNTRFFLEILNNEKSTKLEWTIVILIAAEIVIGLTDLAMKHT
jgi:uncharacterized Rmd1/YagE family protein